MTLSMRSLLVPSRMRHAAIAILGLAIVSLPGCTKQQRDGMSASYLMIDSLMGARGDEPDKDSGVLDSDVITAGSIFADLGKLRLRLGMKDPGVPSNPTVPTQTNFITVTRYHVRYIRTDGRNVQGVDIPYEFDGGATATVTDTGADLVITTYGQVPRLTWLGEVEWSLLVLEQWCRRYLDRVASPEPEPQTLGARA